VGDLVKKLRVRGILKDVAGSIRKGSLLHGTSYRALVVDVVSRKDPAELELWMHGEEYVIRYHIGPHDGYDMDRFS
jgi:hypothetical protein